MGRTAWQTEHKARDCRSRGYRGEEAPRFAFVPGRFMIVATALRRERDQLAGLGGKEVRRRMCEAVVLVEVVVFASLVLAGVGRHEDRLLRLGRLSR